MHEIQEKLLKVASSHSLGKLSLRQIGSLVGDDQPQKIKHHLLQLEKKGLLRINRPARTMSKVNPGIVGNTKLIAIPIFGAANCGPATIYADQNIQGYIQVSGRLLSRKKDVFGLRAEGHSMNKANINGECIEDGDYVVVDPSYRNLKNGDYVLAVVGGVANIKRYFNDRKKKHILLLSESSNSFSPIFIHYDEASDFIVNGRIIQVIKKPKSAWSRIRTAIHKDI